MGLPAPLPGNPTRFEASRSRGLFTVSLKSPWVSPGADRLSSKAGAQDRAQVRGSRPLPSETLFLRCKEKTLGARMGRGLCENPPP